MQNLRQQLPGVSKFRRSSPQWSVWKTSAAFFIVFVNVLILRRILVIEESHKWKEMIGTRKSTKYVLQIAFIVLPLVCISSNQISTTRYSHTLF